MRRVIVETPYAGPSAADVSISKAPDGLLRINTRGLRCIPIVIANSPEGFARLADALHRQMSPRENIEYARRCMRDCLLRGEAPFLSHLLYTQDGVLNDDDPDQRSTGIEAGLAWGDVADATVVYADRGISPGMRMGIQRAEAAGRPVETRYLFGEPAKE